MNNWTPERVNRLKVLWAHRTGRARPKPAQKVKLKPAPAHKPIPWTRPEGPKRDEAVNVRFIERQTDQCSFFIEDQSGPDGLVCGRPVVVKAYCENCARLAYQPLKLASAA